MWGVYSKVRKVLDRIMCISGMNLMYVSMFLFTFRFVRKLAETNVFKKGIHRRLNDQLALTEHMYGYLHICI